MRRPLRSLHRHNPTRDKTGRWDVHGAPGDALPMWRSTNAGHAAPPRRTCRPPALRGTRQPGSMFCPRPVLSAAAVAELPQSRPRVAYGGSGSWVSTWPLPPAPAAAGRPCRPDTRKGLNSYTLEMLSKSPGSVRSQRESGSSLEQSCPVPSSTPGHPLCCGPEWLGQR